MTSATGSPALPPEFVGRPAGVGARILALTIDVLIVAAVSTTVLILTGSWTLGLVVLGELIIGLWVLQARTGVTVGALALRLRVSRADTPFTPGIGRGIVRTAIMAAGALVGGVGLWVVESSAAWTGSKGRSWADLAAGTRVVAVSRHENVLQSTLAPVGEPVLSSTTGAWRSAPAVTEAPSAPVAPAAYAAPVAPVGPAAPAAIPGTPQPPRVGYETPNPVTIAPPAMGYEVAAAPAAPAAVAYEALITAPTASAAPNLASPAAAPEPSPEVTEQPVLILHFDTGQTEALEVSEAAVFGRNPEPVEMADRLLPIHDPDRTVSKSHARIEHTVDGIWVTDFGSTNGTELVDESGRATRLTAGERIQIDDGQRVRFGDRTASLSRLIGGAS